MRFNRPSSLFPDVIDLYGCKNPHCDKRLRPTEHGKEVPKHCGIPATYISTLSKSEWDKIVTRNQIEIQRIDAVIKAGKIRREREKTSN